MAEENDSADKSFEASQKKLDDARKKGDLPRSSDLNATAMYFGMLLAAAAVGGPSLLQFADVLTVFLARADETATRIFAGAGAPVLAPTILSVLVSLTPFAVVPFLLIAVSIIAQRSFVVAPSKLAPKLSRISVLSNAKNKFGSRGLFEFAKSTLKLTLFAWVLFAYLQFRYTDIVLGILASVESATVQMLTYATEFLGLVVLLSLMIGAIDFGWQRFEHLKKLRMSHKELRDEAKEAEGDPYLKQARRSKAEEIALNAMLTNVPDADVIVVNPTHYAVALKWSRAPGTAPECVAKGVDEIAHKIRSIAEEHDIPIHSDPPTARALHAAIDVGQEIKQEHYMAVAAAIRFSDSMRAKAKESIF